MRSLPLPYRFAFALLAIAAPIAAESSRPENVHPWVWERTENGKAVEIFVVLRAEADLSGSDSLESKGEKGWFVFDALTSTAETSQRPLLAQLAERGVKARSFWIVNQVLLAADRSLVLELARRSDVLRIDGNPTISNRLPVAEAPVDSIAAPEAALWNIAKTNAPGVWSMGFQGQGIVVGAQDTGYRWTHEQIKSRYRGWNGSTADHDYNWHDSIHSSSGNPCGNDAPAPCDDYGHGTHTMGTVLGERNGTEYGMAPQAKWIGCRNMDQGNGTPATYLECFQFFLAPTRVNGTNPDPSKSPDVTNNSWGCPAAEGCSWNTLESAVLAQKAAGIMTVVSAGNDGSSCGSVNDPPALYGSAYSVGSSTSSDTLSGFSSRGPADSTGLMKPNIVAPGDNITSASYSSDTGTANMNGTSMAGPNVAGGVALFWSARPAYERKQDETEAILSCTARRLPALVEACGGDYVNGPNNSWGYGLLDVLAAVNAAIPAPASLSATPAGDNRIDLSWTASPGATSYRIFRGTNPGGPYTPIATVGAVTTYSDLTASGGVTYSYVVRAAISCPSLPSNESSATATGPCFMAPSFSGLTAATSAGTATCGIQLSWSAGSIVCPGGGSPTYRIYRSIDPSFTPSVSNRIMAGLSGTSYIDVDGLVFGSTYTYVVRAVDPASGAEDSNLIRRSAAPGGSTSTQTFVENFENGPSGFDLAGWNTSVLSGTNAWTWSTAQSKSPTHSWFSPSQGSVSNRVLVSPSIGVQASTTLSFWHTYAFEGSTGTCYDGGTLEISTDSGTNWNVVPDAAFTAGLFNSTVSTCCGNPIAGKRAWCGGTIGAMTQVSVNLGAYAGQSARLRWREGDDTSAIGTGWYVDSATFSNTLVSSSCATGSAAKPVPDGSFVPGTPITAIEGAGGAIGVAWDVTTCASPSYNVYRGALSDFGVVTGGNCAIGTTGWSPNLPMPDDSWFVVAGAGTSAISSFGRRTGGAEMSPTGWSGVCPQGTQSLANSCP